MAGHGREDPMLLAGGGGHPLHQYQTPANGGKMGGPCWADWNGNSIGWSITKESTSLSGLYGVHKFWPFDPDEVDPLGYDRLISIRIVF